MGVLVSRSLPLKASEALGDEELVRRALTGDRWGREMLYRRHAASLLAMTCRLRATGGAAVVVVLHTLGTPFEQRGSRRAPAAVRGWMGQIAVSLVRRRFRRRKLARLVGLDRGADDATLESLADGGASADQRAELALVDRVLGGMKAPLRIAWMLRHVEGLELTEVAAHADCSLATVKRRIAEADAIVERHVTALPDRAEVVS